MKRWITRLAAAAALAAFATTDQAAEAIRLAITDIVGLEKATRSSVVFGLVLIVEQASVRLRRRVM